MSDANNAVDNSPISRWGGDDSTYVRTIVCINNTYVRTSLLKANALDFGGFGFGQTNAYSITLSRGWR